MKGICLLFLFSIAVVSSASGQHDFRPQKMRDDFLNFFVGEWNGNLEFANGKKISADLSFKLSLDSSWLYYEHTDRLPNVYKSVSMWGLDAVSGQFVSYVFDNFRGHRKFVSDGWKDDKLILTTYGFYPQIGLIFQHFIFEKLSGRSFRMTYETSKDGIKWELGDFLLFERVDSVKQK